MEPLLREGGNEESIQDGDEPMNSISVTLSMTMGLPRGLLSSLQRLEITNESNGFNEEENENFDKSSKFYEVEDVQTNYEEAFREASQTASPSSIPSSWTLPGQNLPCQSPKDMIIDQLYAQAECTKEFAGINNPVQIMKHTPEAMQASERKFLNSLLQKSPEKILSDGDWEYLSIMYLLQYQAKYDDCMELRQIKLE
jgi:hypothetical protein